MSTEPSVIEAGHEALERFGAGTASVRFICGTFTIHRELEHALAGLVGTDASLSFVSCWNANEALPATVLTERDIVLSDQLNHASIIDAIRLAKNITKCTTGVYQHKDLADLDAKLSAAKDREVKMVITDGVFSMEGAIADLPGLMEVCRKHGAVLVVDDSHATGVLGKTGRGTAEHYGMLGQIDVITSTLGKALGGAAGGFVAGSEALCDYLTQRSRPQLFSNALPCTVAGSALAAVRVPRGPSRTGRTTPGEHHLFPGKAPRAGLQADSRRDPDRSGHHRRDRGRHPDERAAARRGRLRHRVRVSGGPPGHRQGPLPDLRGAHPRRHGPGAPSLRQGRKAAQADLA